MSTIRLNAYISNKDNFDFNILYICKSKFENDWKSIPHSHPFTEIFMVTSGSGKLIANDKEYDISKNDIIVINSYTMHSESSDSNSKLEYILIGIENLKFNLNSRSGKLVKKDYYILNAKKNSTAVNYGIFQELFNEIISKKEYYKETIFALSNLLLSSLYREFNLSYEIDSNDLIIGDFGFLKQYMDANFQKKLSLNDLAKFSHFNKYYLIHNFKKQVGTTPMKYLLKKRVEEAIYLINYTNFSLADIAKNTGFSSLSYFSQAFKKITGLSPQDYKNRK